jgi:fluoride exporter
MQSVTSLGIVAVGVGAAIGAWTRWGLSIGLNHLWPNFPLGTFVANAAGGLLVGFAVGFLDSQPSLDPHWRLLIITGCLGGLTTFSTFSLEVVQLLERGQWGFALLLAAAHLSVSLCLTGAGFWLARGA